METYSKTKDCLLYCGNMLEALDAFEENSIDSIITDPPYELNFMCKGWDNAGVSFDKNTWKKCLRVLKPGGYLLAFGGSRTYHRIACAIEDAGFEIRDTIMWLYGSGFPKSMNIAKGIEAKKKYGKANTVAKRQIEQDGNGKEYEVVQTNNGAMGEKKVFSRKEYTPSEETAVQWKGWGTCLKPSFEPIIVARKPFKGSCVDNVLKYGVGGINIDECRVGTEIIKGGTMPDFRDIGEKSKRAIGIDKLSFGQVENAKRKPLDDHIGRFPANTILTYDETDFDEVCGGFPNSGSGNNGSPYNYAGREYNNRDTSMFNGDKPQAPSNYNDKGSASRYFYCAKASKKDRDEGLDDFEKDITDDGRNKPIDNPYLRGKTLRHNTHPTVKPTTLMQYLIRLVSPKGATILDPFMGSGSTGKAVMYENKERDANYKFIGIEKDAEYCKIAEARIKNAELEK